MPSVYPKATAAVTDGSAAVTSGGTSEEVFPANARRLWLFIQNLSDTDMYVRFGTHASASFGSIKLPGNNTTPLNLDGTFIPMESVHLFCATTNKQFTALEG